MPLADLLARWQSHKIVRAAKIIFVRDDDSMVLDVTDPATGQPASVRPADRMFSRYRPVPGDYYVIYPDGYASISPAEAFVSGYHPL